MSDNRKEKLEGAEQEMEAELFPLIDENGEEKMFELIGSAEIKGTNYYAFIPADTDEDADVIEYVILKSVIEDGEEILVTIDDDDENDDVSDYFDDMFAQEIDYDLPADGDDNQ